MRLNHTQIGRNRSSHFIRMRPWRRMRGRTRLLARTDRLVRLQDTQCYSSLVPTTPVPTRVPGSQGGPRSPEYCTRHICPLPDRFTLARVLAELPRWSIIRNRMRGWLAGLGRALTSSHTSVHEEKGFLEFLIPLRVKQRRFHPLPAIHLISSANTPRQESC